MMYIIEKNGLQPEYVQPEQEQIYVIKHFKTAVDAEGNEVEVVDDSRVERVTIGQLENRKAQYQSMIDEINDELSKISKL